MQDYAMLRDGLIGCFKAGIKAQQWVGAEFEHFVVNRNTLKSYHYYEENGIRQILVALKGRGWETHQSDDQLMFLKNATGTITLEPGGQLELSVMPQETIGDIERIYRAFVADVQSLLLPEQALVSCGYHPRSKIDEIPFIPKSRYAAMSAYFKTTGRYAHNMMKGTASTQVGIDFSSEADCQEQYRLFSALSPFIAAYFDSAAFFEGSPYPEHTVRTKIWAETDPARSGVPPITFDEGMSFDAYAQYVANVPPILLSVEGEALETGTKTVGDLALEMPFEKEQYEHVLTMVFPDIRLKNFLEIRMADALPYPHNFAVVELIHGLAYHPVLSKRYRAWSKSMDYKQYQGLRDGVIARGLMAPYKTDLEGFEAVNTVGDFIQKIVGDMADNKVNCTHLKGYNDIIKNNPQGFGAYLATLSQEGLLRALEVNCDGKSFE